MREVKSLERRALKWLLSGDTGISSETMIAVALGITRGKSSGLDAPSDVSDFGRCYRLVQKIPELRDHFKKIGRRAKVFRGILKNWDELVAIYLRDMPTGKSTEFRRRSARPIPCA